MTEGALAKALEQRDAATAATLNGDRRLYIDSRVVSEDITVFGGVGPEPGHTLSTRWLRVDHLNPVRVRCPSCAQMTDLAAGNGACACGQPLPESPPYW